MCVPEIFGYKGQYGYYTDAETGLILCTHRYYDPAGGRWVTRDPIGLAGGMNLYGYCGGEPVGWVDPSGARALGSCLPGIKNAGQELALLDADYDYALTRGGNFREFPLITGNGDTHFVSVIGHASQSEAEMRTREADKIRREAQNDAFFRSATFQITRKTVRWSPALRLVWDAIESNVTTKGKAEWRYFWSGQACQGSEVAHYICDAGRDFWDPFAFSTEKSTFENCMVGVSLATLAYSIKGVPASALGAEGMVTGSGLYRNMTSNTGAFSGLSEPLRLRHVKAVAEQAGVGLDGVRVRIIRDPGLARATDFTGHAPGGRVIELYPGAFQDRQTLVRTLMHERMHVYQFETFGKGTIKGSTAMAGAAERGAAASEAAAWEFYLRGGR